MKFNFFQSGVDSRNRLLQGCGVASMLLLVALFSPELRAQAARRQQQPTVSLLDARIAAAQQARSSGNPAAIAAANQLLIAEALRQVAELKLIEGDFANSIQLYQDSLKLESLPGAYSALAFAEVQAGDLNKAIEFAAQAQSKDPKDLRAARVLASAYDQKGLYSQAVGPFTQVANADPSVDNLYPLAVCLLQTKKTEDKLRAESVFEQMKKTAGDSGSLHVLIGRAYRDAGDMPAAVREFERAIAIDPRTPHAHYFLGLAHLFMNDWKPTPEVEVAFRKEAEYFPNDYLANYMLGFLTAGERKYDESNQYLEAAAKLSPTTPDPFLYLGMNAFAEEKMDRAEAMLRKAVELTGADEARTNYQIRRAYVDLSRILFQSGRLEESKAFAAKARELENKTMEDTQRKVSSMVLTGGTGSAAAVIPLSREQENQSAPVEHDSDDPFVRRKLTPEQRTAADAREKALHSVLALAFNDLATTYAMGKEYSQALGYYQQAEHWDSALPGLAKNLGQCAFRVQDYSEAARGLSMAIEQGQDSPALHAMLGISYYATDHYKEAAAAFAPLGTDGMTDSETGYAWAASLTHLGDLKHAAEVLTTFESEPRSNQTLLLTGQLWTEIGDFARAIASLQRALDSDPSLLKAHYYQGLAYIHWEHWPEAAKAFQAELASNPNDPDALYHLGFAEMQQSKTDDALELFLQVIAAHPDYANAQYEAGKILMDRDQYKDAIVHLEAAARLNPEKDYMHYQLQAAYRKLGRTEDAERELEIYKGLKARSREHVADAIKNSQ